MINIENLHKLCKENKIEWTLHALKRIRARNIRSVDVIDCILNGEIIENYPDDRPLPSCLIYSQVKTKHLHTVIGVSPEMIYIITAYEPNRDEWEDDFRTRRENIK